jgi:dephospho-CoA kinase
MVKIAVTGGIACGKSLVGAVLAEEGVAVLDADEIARELMQPGSRVFERVVRAFGGGILDGGGRIDRGRLAGRVFSDREALAALNAIVHPEARRRWQRRLSALRGTAAAAVLVPLLYEAGMAGGWDAVVCVAASERTQIRRLAARGLSEQEARRRIGAQMPVAAKMERADFVVMNDGTRDALRDQTLRILRRVMEKGTRQ